MRRRSSNDKLQTWRIGACWNCFKSPTPIRTKLVPAKIQFEDVLYRTHVIDLVWCALFNSIGNFCEKTAFEKQRVRFLVCIPKRELHFGKTYFFKQVFSCVLRSWYCLFLKVFHFERLFLLLFACFLLTTIVASTKFVPKLLHVRFLLRCPCPHQLSIYFSDFAYTVEWGIFISSRSVSWFISWRDDSGSVF